MRTHAGYESAVKTAFLFTREGKSMKGYLITAAVVLVVMAVANRVPAIKSVVNP